MILRFVDGSTVEVSDISTITGLNIEAVSLSALGEMLSHFTEENMKHVTLGDKDYHVVIPQSFSISHDFGAEKIQAYIVCRFKTSEEMMTEQITELQEAVAELAGE